MSESYWWCSNCKEEVDGRRVTFSEKHMDCGHYVECITPEEHGRIAVLEDEMRFLNKARDSYLSQALNHGITIIKLKEDMKEQEAELAAMKRQPHGPSCTCNDCRESLEIEMRSEGK